MFGLLGAATTGLLAWRMFGRRTGWIAGVFYATTILPMALAQAASHDVALVPWVNLAMLLLWECIPPAAEPVVSTTCRGLVVSRTRRVRKSAHGVCLVRADCVGRVGRELPPVASVQGYSWGYRS